MWWSEDKLVERARCESRDLPTQHQISLCQHWAQHISCVYLALYSLVLPPHHQHHPTHQELYRWLLYNTGRARHSVIVRRSQPTWPVGVESQSQVTTVFSSLQWWDGQSSYSPVRSPSLSTFTSDLSIFAWCSVKCEVWVTLSYIECGLQSMSVRWGDVVARGEGETLLSPLSSDNIPALPGQTSPVRLTTAHHQSPPNIKNVKNVYLKVKTVKYWTFLQ